MAKEYTKEELIKLLNQHSEDGKVSFGSLGEIIFDSKFPDELFQNAKDQIIEARNDEKIFKEASNILLEKYQEVLRLQKKIIRLSEDKLNNLEQIIKLKKEQAEIEREIEPLESEFKEIQARIKERKGE